MEWYVSVHHISTVSMCTHLYPCTYFHVLKEIIDTTECENIFCSKFCTLMISHKVVTNMLVANKDLNVQCYIICTDVEIRLRCNCQSKDDASLSNPHCIDTDWLVG